MVKLVKLVHMANKRRILGLGSAAATTRTSTCATLTNFHIGAHETLCCSIALFYHSVLRFTCAIRWECGIFRFESGYLWFSRRCHRDGYGSALPGSARFETRRRAPEDPHAGSAYGG